MLNTFIRLELLIFYYYLLFIFYCYLLFVIRICFKVWKFNCGKKQQLNFWKEWRWRKRKSIKQRGKQGKGETSGVMKEGERAGRHTAHGNTCAQFSAKDSVSHNAAHRPRTHVNWEQSSNSFFMFSKTSSKKCYENFSSHAVFHLY